MDDCDNSELIAVLTPLVGAVLDDMMLEEWLLETSSGKLLWDICGMRVPVGPVLRADLPARFGFVAAPQPPEGAP